MSEPPASTGVPRRTASRLGLKVAAGMGVVCFGVLLTLYGLGVLASPWGLLLASLLVAAGAYLLADLLLTRRLDLARRALKDVRQHRFESLERLHVPHGDELNALIWQVYRAGLAMEKEIGELKKLEYYRRDFLGNVSHELKTPIFAIQGFAETLLDGALDDQRFSRAFVEKILRNTERLKNLSRDLTELTRIETGDLKMEQAPFSLARVAADVAESLEALAEARQVHLTRAIPEGLPPALGDRERIRQVLTNLLDNAIKYNRPGGSVEVHAEAAPDGSLHVTVVDTGVGVAPQHVERLTERFFRADKSRSREQGGTGLGLAIVKHILAAHGTRLHIESRPGEGSVFGFTLPSAGTPRNAVG